MALSSETASEVVQRRIGDRLGLNTQEAAQGIIDIVNSSMADAIRMITIERGHDPRSFTLVAFGGAGPVHAGRLAQDLNIETVVVPPNPGVFSATGLVSTDLERDYVQTIYAELEGDVLEYVREAYRPMEREAKEMLSRSGIDEEQWQLRYSMDLRYTH